MPVGLPSKRFPSGSGEPPFALLNSFPQTLMETPAMTPFPNDQKSPDELHPKLTAAARPVAALLTYGQAAALIAIALAALAGIGLAVAEMVASRSAGLAELLLLFLYVEILSMVKCSALGTREIPIHTPIMLAVVAVARYIVVDVEHIEGSFLVMASGAILILVCALWVIGRVRAAKDNQSH